MQMPHRSPTRPRRVAAVAALSLAALLAGCGGGSSSDGSASPDDTTTPTELPADTSSGDARSGDATTTTAGSPAADVDICGEITQADMEAILPEATFSSVAPNDVIPTPSCYYNIELTGGVEAAVVQIVLAAPGDPSYLDGQRQIQADAVDVPGLDDAFAYDDFGTILVLGDAGVYLVERGVELTEGGEAASQDQMVAIAERVAAL